MVQGDGVATWKQPVEIEAAVLIHIGVGPISMDSESAIPPASVIIIPLPITVVVDENKALNVSRLFFNGWRRRGFGCAGPGRGDGDNLWRWNLCSNTGSDSGLDWRLVPGWRGGGRTRCHACCGPALDDRNLGYFGILNICPGRVDHDGPEPDQAAKIHLAGSAAHLQPVGEATAADGGHGNPVFGANGANPGACAVKPDVGQVNMVKAGWIDIGAGLKVDGHGFAGGTLGNIDRAGEAADLQHPLFKLDSAAIFDYQGLFFTDPEPLLGLIQKGKGEYKGTVSATQDAVIERAEVEGAGVGVRLRRLPE